MTDLDLLKVRVIVTDAEALGRLEPAAVRAYLANAGWTRARERATGAIWTRQLDDSVASVFQPNDPTYADFALRMGVLLSALAIAEDRSQLAVLADLGTANAPVPSGAERIAVERRGQIEAEGWTPEHDDQHDDGEIAAAAVCYAVPPDLRDTRPGTIPDLWPFEDSSWEPTPDDRVRELVKAGALIAAEIDRLVRQAERRPQPTEAEG